MNVLNDRYEIPRPEIAELCFYLKEENGGETVLKLERIAAFDISTDVAFHFSVDKKPVLVRPHSIPKFVLRGKERE